MPAISSPKSHSTSVSQSYFSPSSTILHKVAKSFTAITISLSVHVHCIRVSSHSFSFSLQKIFNHCICPFYPFHLSRSYWYLLYLLSPWLYLRREKPYSESPLISFYFSLPLSLTSTLPSFF